MSRIEVDAALGFVEFVAIVDHGSISAAARALDLPRETLGRRLAQLETRLGTTLLHRTTRRLDCSPAGRDLYVQARRIVEDAHAAAAAVRGRTALPRGLLRLTIPPTDGNPVISAMLAAFLERHPEMRLEVMATVRHVDLVAEGFDVALRAGPVVDPDLVAVRVLRSRWVVVAAPARAATLDAAEGAAALTQLPCILSLRAENQRGEDWPLWDGGSVPVTGKLATDDLMLRLAAARDGAGFALLPQVVTMPTLAAGDLVHVLGDKVGADADVFVVYRQRQHLDRRLRAFVDHAIAWFTQDPAPR